MSFGTPLIETPSLPSSGDVAPLTPASDGNDMISRIKTIERFYGIPLAVWYHVSYVSVIVCFTVTVVLAIFGTTVVGETCLLLGFFGNVLGWIDTIQRAKEEANERLHFANTAYDWQIGFATLMVLYLLFSLVMTLIMMFGHEHVRYEVLPFYIVAWIMTMTSAFMSCRIASFRRQYDLV